MRRLPRLRTLLIVCLMIGAALGIAACDAAASAAPSAVASPGFFVGPQWSALTIRGLAVPPDTPVVVRFTPASVEGSGPCNSFGGHYQFDAASGRVAFDQVASTLRACVDENRTSIDTAFFQTLSRADRLFLDADGRLHLTGPAGEIVLAKMVEG